MKNDASITHQENEINEENGTESVLSDTDRAGRNAAAVSGQVAGKEALRSMAMNEEAKRKKTDLTTGG